MWIALLLLAGGNLTLGCALGLKLNVNRLLRLGELTPPPAEPAPAETSTAELSIAPVDTTPPAAAPIDDQSNALFRQLQGWLSGMNQNIGEHNSRLEVLGGQIKGCTSSDPEAIAMLVAQIVEANNTLHGELNSARNEIVEKQQQLERRTTEARTDALSGLANRRAFDDALSQGMQNAKTENKPMCLMMLDIDHFKKFNDTHGHQAGDAVLRQVAKVLATGAVPGSGRSLRRRRVQHHLSQHLAGRRRPTCRRVASGRGSAKVQLRRRGTASYRQRGTCRVGADRQQRVVDATCGFSVVRRQGRGPQSRLLLRGGRRTSPSAVASGMPSKACR